MESVKRSHTQLWGSSHAPLVAARHTITLRYVSISHFQAQTGASQPLSLEGPLSLTKKKKKNVRKKYFLQCLHMIFFTTHQK